MRESHHPTPEEIGFFSRTARAMPLQEKQLSDDAETVEEYFARHPESSLLRPDPALGPEERFVYHYTKAKELARIEQDGLWPRMDAKDHKYLVARMLAEYALDKYIPNEYKTAGISRGGAAYAVPQARQLGPSRGEYAVLKVKVSEQNAFVFDMSRFENLAFYTETVLDNYYKEQGRNPYHIFGEEREKILEQKDMLDRIAQDEVVKELAEEYWQSGKRISDTEGIGTLESPEVLFSGAPTGDIRFLNLAQYRELKKAA